MPSYPDHANPDLVRRIPLNAHVILDVGCATGALGAAYRRLNPRARILGIEKDAEVAAIAATRLDAVAVVDVEQDPLPFDLTDGIDCIVYGDVLEHLNDPWSVLRAQSDALNEDGTILICVPNMEHWSFVDRLLRGTWTYEATGLFDGTHLRWFTRKTMYQGLRDLGLVPQAVHPRIFDAEQAVNFADALAPTLDILGIELDAYRKRSQALQYVWQVRKYPKKMMTIAANMLVPIGGVSHVRVLDPLEAIGRDDSVMTMLSPANDPPGMDQARPDHIYAAPDGPRIFILHRPALVGSAGLQTIEALLRDDWLIVTEFDDHPDYFRIMQGDEQYAFLGVHAIQTSTPALARILHDRNPEIAIFPNSIRRLPDLHNFTDPNRMTLFFGALNREQDWGPLMPALNAVAAVVGDRLHFRVVHDQGFFDALATPHKDFTPTCDYDTYMSLLGSCEISLMPLLDTPFNRAKSDLKFIEAGACRVVPLASAIVYADSIENGRTGLLFHNVEEMRMRLLRLVVMPEMARAIAGGARAHVAGERMLAYQVASRINWYRSLWDRRTELTEALRSRLKAATRTNEAGG